MKTGLVLRPRRFPVSFQLDPRAVFVLSVLSLFLIAAILLHVMLGEYPIAALDVLRTIFTPENTEYGFVVTTLRLPRALIASLAGMSLAVSGAIVQGIVRNPLASPDVIGIGSGAGLAAVIVIVLFPSSPLYVLPVSALLGAVAAAVLIYLLAWKAGSSPLRLILAGIGISAILQALITIITISGKIHLVRKAAIWMAGSIYSRSWEHFWPLLPWTAVFIPLVMALSRHLNALELGEDVAKGLGTQIEWKRGLLLFACVALVGSAVATAGTIGFVGLMAPHIARRLVGSGHGALVPASALVGGLIVLLADLAGKLVFAPIEIPVGIVTAVIGAPYFVSLLISQRNR
jgi:iron complex transport system permease protein